MESKAKADWLDEYVQERSDRSPAFAESWAVAEQELEIARARKEAGMTQAQVAKAMGISQPRVAEIEREPDKVSMGIMRKYAAAVGMEVTLRPKAGSTATVRSKGTKSTNSRTQIGANSVKSVDSAKRSKK